MDIGNIVENQRKDFYVREVIACDHVGINYLVLAGTRNFFSRGPSYTIFEQDLCKILCPECFIKGAGYRPS